jgi:tellurite resistance protein
MHIDKSFLHQVAARIAQPKSDAATGAEGSTLTVAAGSYGFRNSQEEHTMPTGFDPHAAALFESIVEAAYLVATADGVFDDAERDAFRQVVLEACRGAVSADQLEALLADLGDQLAEDGVEKRIDMVARGVTRDEHQREVLRIAAVLAHASGDVSEVERGVVVKLSKAFCLPDEHVDAVLKEVHETLAQARAQQ